MPALHFCLRAIATLIIGVGVGVIPALAATAAGGADLRQITATCAACHGTSGEGSGAGIPRLAGQNPDYLAHALSMFKEHTRASDTMQAIAQNLSDSEMRELATYYSRQHPPRIQTATAPDPAVIAAGQRLAESGAGSAVAACFSCHGAGGKGNGARFPSIAGQPEAFLISRLHEFQDRAKKAPPPPGSMTAVSTGLDDTQIKEAAAYLSTLAP